MVEHQEGWIYLCCCWSSNVSMVCAFPDNFSLRQPYLHSCSLLQSVKRATCLPNILTGIFYLPQTTSQPIYPPIPSSSPLLPVLLFPIITSSAVAITRYGISTPRARHPHTFSLLASTGAATLLTSVVSSSISLASWVLLANPSLKAQLTFTI